jgi:integrase
MRGSVVKRGKNSWAVVVDLARDSETGKRRQKWFSHTTRHEAEAHLAQILAAMQGGTWMPPAKVRLADYLERWLSDYAVGAVRQTTLASYRMIIDTHISSALGNVPLAILSPQTIQGYFSRKLKQGLSATTVRHHAMLLHEALRHAVRWGLLPRNPSDLVDAPRNRSVEIRILDEEQQRLFLAEAKRSSRYYRLYLAALTRAGELLGLRWKDVDLSLSVASVCQTFYRLGGKRCDYCRDRARRHESAPTFDASRCQCTKGQMLFKEPKTARSRRTVALPAVLVDELHALRLEQDESRRRLKDLYATHGLIFCQHNGKPLHLNDIRRGDFRDVLQRAGLPRITFHALRHSHASLLGQMGVPVKVIQERLGHSTPAFTLQVYSHVLPGMQEQAAAQLEERLLTIRGVTSRPPHP